MCEVGQPLHTQCWIYKLYLRLLPKMMAESQLCTPYIEKETMKYIRVMWNSRQRHERWRYCGLE